MTFTLLLASQNAGKRAELSRMLAGVAITLRAPEDYGIEQQSIAETGTTFAENARLKAVASARDAGIPALADDSGLCVSALAGAPGVHTARFGGAGLTDGERRQLLLSRLAALGRETERSAEFCCAVCVADPSGAILGESEGRCSGHIALSDQTGPYGFGYDPLFIPAGFGQSFAQLPDAVKDRISHRGRAILAIIPQLESLRIVHESERPL